jgi:hypothetical protein
MKKMKPLDQVCSIGAYAPNRTSKLQNKSENDDSILGRLIEFASSVPEAGSIGKCEFSEKFEELLFLCSETEFFLGLREFESFTNGSGLFRWEKYLSLP